MVEILDFKAEFGGWEGGFWVRTANCRIGGGLWGGGADEDWDWGG